MRTKLSLSLFFFTSGAIASSVLFATDAAAAQDPEVAAQLYKEADEARLAGDFESCISKAEKAYATYPQAQIRGLQGTCENALDRFVDAATHLAYYFDNTSGEPPEDFKKAFTRAQGRTAKISVACQPDGVAITVDGVSRGTAPLTIYVEPGLRVIVATKKGLEAKEERKSLDAGTKVSISFELRGKDVGGPTAKDGRLPMWPAVVGFSVAGAGVLLGAGMTIASALRSGQAADVSRGCDAGRYSECISEGQSISDEADTFGTVGVVGFAVGGAALLFAIPYTAVAAGGGSSEVGFVPVLSPDFAGGLIRARF